MTARELFALLDRLYDGEPDGFRLSIGHTAPPLPSHPATIFNQPECRAMTNITLADVRRWAKEEANAGN